MQSKRTDTHMKVLNSGLRLSKAVLRECVETKYASPIGFWVFGLLAKMTSSATSVALLVRECCTADAKLVLRSILDAVIDLLYILEDSRRQKGLVEVFALEWDVDAYERLSFYAKHRGMPLQDFVKKHPTFQKVLDAYERTIKHPAFATPPAQEPRRWKHIRTQEKLKAVQRFAKASEPLAYTVRALGDAHAHCRPTALVEFIRVDRNRALRVDFKPRRTDFLYSPELVAFEASLCLLLACDQVIDRWYLDERLSKRVQELFDRLRNLKNKRP